jgi:hypothetical protein
MADSELIETMELANGDTVRKWRFSDGSIQYRRGGDTESGRTGGTPITKKQGEMLEKNAMQSPNSGVQFDVQPTKQGDRENVLRQKYEGYGQDYKRLDPSKYSGNEPEEDRLTKIWKGNEQVKQKIKNDPFLRTNKERDKAREAYARKIANELMKANSEDDAVEILRQYGVTS